MSVLRVQLVQRGKLQGWVGRGLLIEQFKKIIEKKTNSVVK